MVSSSFFAGYLQFLPVKIHILECGTPTTLTNPKFLISLTIDLARLLIYYKENANNKSIPCNVKSINNCSNGDNFHFRDVLLDFLQLFLYYKYFFNLNFFSFFRSPLLFTFSSCCSFSNISFLFLGTFSSWLFSLIIY